MLAGARVHVRGQLERTLPFWPAAAIERLQQARVRSIVRHAYETVPFYRRALDERGLRPDDFRTAEDLERLPLLDQATVQERLAEFVSSRYADERSRGETRSAATTTGVRRTLYWDNRFRLLLLPRHERVRPIVLRLAGEARGRMLLRNALGERGAAKLARRLGREVRPDMTALPEQPATGSLSTLWSSRTGWQQGRLHAISPLVPYEEVVARMNELRPRVMSSYGSYADAFFRHLEEARVDVHLPRVWDTTGDAVSPATRDLAAERGCRIHSTYYAAEAGFLGFECERCNGHHINVDLCAVRVVGDDGRKVAAGSTGEVVISNLVNRATVLLNCCLGDRGALAAEPCPCGRSLPLLARLEGRVSELLELADGRTISALDVEMQLRDELRTTRRLQLSQPSPGAIHARIVPFRDVDGEALRDSLLRRAAEVFGDSATFSVELVDDLPSTPAGKFRRVV